MVDISIVVCAYNEGGHIRESIRSVSAQTLSPNRFELVIVDDGSTDGTVTAAERATSDVPYETRVVENETNRGLVYTANQGVEHARGTYVVRLDADDSFAPQAVERLLDTAETSGTDLVYTDRYEVDIDARTADYVTADEANLFSFVAAGTLMRRNLLQRVGGYRDFFWEEYDMYLRYLKASETDPVHIDKPLMVYLRHGESMTMDETQVREGWAELIDHWGKDMLEQYGTLPSDIDR